MSKNFKFKTVITYSVLFLVITSLIAFITVRLLNTFNSANSTFTGIIERNSQTEIVLIYVGCSTCGAAQVPELPETFKSLSKKVEGIADSLGFEYLKMGISNEESIEDGLTHLKKISTFNEIAIGNGMGNTSLQKYIWDELDNLYEAGIPQVLILKRKYSLQENSDDFIISSKIEEEEILVRRLGVQGMIELLNDESYLKNI